MRLDAMPGCCGIRVLHGLSACDGQPFGPCIHGCTRCGLITAQDVRNRLALAADRYTLATVNSEQKAELQVLQEAGFVVLTFFKNPITGREVAILGTGGGGGRQVFKHFKKIFLEDMTLGAAGFVAVIMAFGWMLIGGLHHVVRHFL